MAWDDVSEGKLAKVTGNESGTRRELLTSSKTFFRPRWVRAEHSVYLTAPTSRARRSPCSVVMGRCFCLASFSMWEGSSLRRVSGKFS
jgi:hypothetical protein